MSSSDDDDDDNETIPSAAVCENLCKEFAEITNSDTALGHMCLQNAAWNLEVALNRYFAANSSSTTTSDSMTTQKRPGKDLALTMPDESSDGGTPVESVAASSTGGTSTRVSVKSAANKQPADLKLLSWNIDGLDQNGLDIRTKAVCTIVLKEKPTVVFLQEVVDGSLAILANYLDDEYWVLRGKQPFVEPPPYFTAMLLKKDAVELGREPELIPFSGSIMGRALLKIELEIFGLPCILMTAHLESTKECSPERVEQLRRCFDVLDRKVPDNVTAFFGGDLNLRDEELEQVGGIPSGVNDLWVACGSPKQFKYTWDCLKNDNLNAFENKKFKPRCRFDRLYVKHRVNDTGPVWKPNGFRFVGTERIRKYSRFPSDHWGIACDLIKI